MPQARWSWVLQGPNIVASKAIQLSAWVPGSRERLLALLERPRTGHLAPPNSTRCNEAAGFPKRRRPATTEHRHFAATARTSPTQPARDMAKNAQQTKTNPSPSTQRGVVLPDGDASVAAAAHEPSATLRRARSRRAGNKGGPCRRKLRLPPGSRKPAAIEKADPTLAPPAGGTTRRLAPNPMNPPPSRPSAQRAAGAATKTPSHHRALSQWRFAAGRNAGVAGAGPGAPGPASRARRNTVR